MSETDYNAVVDKMHLPDGSLWPLPVTLDVTEAFVSSLADVKDIALRDEEGLLLAILQISSQWKPDHEDAAQKIYNTKNPESPDVDLLLNHTNPVYLGGRLLGVQLPVHYDFVKLRHTPAQLRKLMNDRGWKNTMAYYATGVIHRPEQELTLAAAKKADAALLIQPAVANSGVDERDYYARVRCCEKVMTHYDNSTSFLNLVPLPIEPSGTREVLLHAIIRQNYGCSHFVLGPDGNEDRKLPAPELLKELNIQVAFLGEAASKNGAKLHVPHLQIRKALERGETPPQDVSFPEILDEMKKEFRPPWKRGLTIFFTGLSGSGKSTIANALRVRLLEYDPGRRAVTLLDGDLVRQNLSKELGFSKEHRDINIRRIAYVASEITKHGGIALCAPIAPYTATRRYARDITAAYGSFVEVFVATPLSTCEKRDRKGLYAKARAGILTNFTGISDPYEEPENAELNIDTTDLTVEAAVDQIYSYLEKNHLLSAP